jgi:hydroxymethylglutaryl-CoA synthase
MVGIISHGAYIPRYRIKTEEIARIHGKNGSFIKKELMIDEKSVPGCDEDSLTMAFEASINALKRVSIDKAGIGAVYSGSESKVYAVKPNASILGDMLGIGTDFTSADMEFACKGGTAGLQSCLGLSKSGFIKYGLAAGTDTAQSSPGDILEYTAAAGAAAFIVGNEKDEIIAELEFMHSVSSDTPDFWRRNMQLHPMHAERFTGVPAYFRHLAGCAKKLLEKAKMEVDDIDFFAFHTPNGKFPSRAGEMLGIPKEKYDPSLIVTKIGNTYSGASLLVFSHVLDNAKPGQRIMLVSFGSGAGSDGFIFKVTDNIKKLKNARTVQSYIDDKEYVDYAQYCMMTGAVK